MKNPASASAIFIFLMITLGSAVFYSLHAFACMDQEPVPAHIKALDAKAILQARHYSEEIFIAKVDTIAIPDKSVKSYRHVGVLIQKVVKARKSPRHNSIYGWQDVSDWPDCKTYQTHYNNTLFKPGESYLMYIYKGDIRRARPMRDTTPATRINVKQELEILEWKDLQPVYQLDMSQQRVSVLHLSAFMGDIKKAREIVRTQPRLLNARDALGKTALHYAQYHKRYDFALELAKLGASIIIEDNLGLSAAKEILWTHARRQSTGDPASDGLRHRILKIMLQRINSKQELNKYPEDTLVRLLESADLPLIKLALAKGFSATAWQGGNSPPIFFAQDLKSLKLLVSHGADVNSVSANGTTLLHRYLDRKRYALVRYLLDQGVLVNDTKQSSLFHLVTGVNGKNLQTRIHLAQRLIQHGADVNARDPLARETVLHRLARNQSRDTATTVKMIEFLLAQGADKNLKNTNAKTAHETAFHPVIKQALQ